MAWRRPTLDGLIAARKKICAASGRAPTCTGMPKLKPFIIASGVALFAGLAFAAPDWSQVKSKAEQFKTKHQELVKLAPVEARKIVAAACAASGEDRKRAAERAAGDARSRVNDRYNELERIERDVVDQLDDIADDSKDAHRSEARSLRDDIKSKWDRLRDTTRTLRDGNHPVIDVLARGAASAQRDRAGRCDARDVSLGSGRASCLYAQGDTCEVVELTADSSSAVSRARDQARRYASDLNEAVKKPDSDAMRRLISADRDFAKCKRFEPRVDCFKQCPEIGDDLRVREVSPSWREGC
jgi:hypothetical protein